jgi:hypothetical protein
MSNKEGVAARRQRKQFETTRRNLQRALPNAVKAVAKKSGWRTAQGVLFREVEGWFIEVHAVPWIAEAKTPAELHCKPMGLDPLFWSIVGLDENINQPLSFRAFGAFTCRTPAIRQIDIPEGGESAEHVAEELLRWADEQLQSLQNALSISAFVEFIRTHPHQIERQSHLAALVTGLLLQGKVEEALSICNETRSETPLAGGFLFAASDGTKTFLDLAVEWITNARRTVNPN